MEFVRTQGVVALGVGLVMGVAVKDLVDTVVGGLVDPIVTKITGGGSSLSAKHIVLAGMDFRTGTVLLAMIKFVAIIAVIYYGLKLFKLDKLTKKD